MAIPAFYKQIGKQAKDLLTKDYEKNLPAFKVETKAENDATFTVEGKIDSKSGEFVIDPLQYKYDFTNRGISITTKASSNRKLSEEIVVVDKFVKGLKITSSLSTILKTKADQVSDNTVKAGIEYSRENLAVTGDIEFVKRFASFSGVVGAKSVAVGGEVEVDLSKSELSKYNASIAYSPSTFAVTASLTDRARILGGSVFNKVDDNTSVGGEFGYELNGNKTSFTVGAQHKLDKDTTIKGKLDFKGVAHFSYIQNIRKNVRAVFSTEIDALGKADGHKVGFGLSFTD